MSNTQIAQNPSPWTFGRHDRLAKAMAVAGLGNAEMADALDVSRNTITNYTSGRTNPSRLQVKEWALKTGAPFEWLWDGVEPTVSQVGGGTHLHGVDQPLHRNITVWSLAPVTEMSQFRAARKSVA